MRLFGFLRRKAKPAPEIIHWMDEHGNLWSAPVGWQVARLNRKTGVHELGPLNVRYVGKDDTDVWS